MPIHQQPDQEASRCDISHAWGSRAWWLRQPVAHCSPSSRTPPFQFPACPRIPVAVSLAELAYKVAKEAMPQYNKVQMLMPHHIIPACQSSSAVDMLLAQT